MIDHTTIADAADRKRERDKRTELIKRKQSTIRIWQQDPSTRKEIERLTKAIELLQTELQKRIACRDNLSVRIEACENDILRAKQDIVVIDAFRPAADVTQAVRDAAKHLSLEQLQTIQRLIERGNNGKGTK